MNFVFAFSFIISVSILLFINPNGVLSAMLSGGQKAFDLTLKLAVIYAVWLGVFEIMEKSGLSNLIAKKLKPLNKLLFGKTSDTSSSYMSLNIAANMLGISGATTPMGIKAVNQLEKENNTYAITVFFVINATSIQLIPTSVMSLRTSLGSLNPSDIILPTILATAISTLIGLILVKIFVKR